MTKKTAWIVTLSITSAAGIGFWLWWRQKDAVPPSAIPIMQQARATVAGTTTTGASSGVPPLVAAAFPTDIALPSNSTT